MRGSGSEKKKEGRKGACRLGYICRRTEFSHFDFRRYNIQHRNMTHWNKICPGGSE